MSDVLQVSTATETREAARALAESAVAARLAAGAQITGPVDSVFWHLDQQGTAQEWRLLLTTTKARWPDLQRHLAEHHPWDNPEIIAVEVADGSTRCLDWVRQATAAG